MFFPKKTTILFGHDASDTVYQACIDFDRILDSISVKRTALFSTRWREKEASVTGLLVEEKSCGGRKQNEYRRLAKCFCMDKDQLVGSACQCAQYRLSEEPTFDTGSESVSSRKKVVFTMPRTAAKTLTLLSISKSVFEARVDWLSTKFSRLSKTYTKATWQNSQKTPSPLAFLRSAAHGLLFLPIAIFSLSTNKVLSSFNAYFPAQLLSTLPSLSSHPVFPEKDIYFRPVKVQRELCTSRVQSKTALSYAHTTQNSLKMNCSNLVPPHRTGTLTHISAHLILILSTFRCRPPKT